jgi:hypothetical protein
VDLRSFGVEEELLLVDPDSGARRSVAGAVSSSLASTSVIARTPAGAEPANPRAG